MELVPVLKNVILVLMVIHSLMLNPESVNVLVFMFQTSINNQPTKKNNNLFVLPNNTTKLAPRITPGTLRKF